MRKFLVLVLAGLLFSCTKDRLCSDCDTETGFVDATILDAGPLESDGCGWVVKIGDDQYFHPDALEGEFRENNLRVKICYELTKDDFRCGIAALPMPVIHVIGIKK